MQGQSARLICGYIYANAGEGESTTDLVFGGHNLIAENGTILGGSESGLRTGLIYCRIWMCSELRMSGERMTTFTESTRESCRLSEDVRLA